MGRQTDAAGGTTFEVGTIDAPGPQDADEPVLADLGAGDLAPADDGAAGLDTTDGAEEITAADGADELGPPEDLSDAGPSDAADDPEDGGSPKDDSGSPGTDLDADAGCNAESCDDENPCTDDTCTPSGCASTPNDAECDDGVFCNGTDTCADRSCSIHAGDPCPGLSICNEDESTCDGCAGNEDCPDPTADPWSDCTFATTCAAEGTQSRSVRTFVCEEGSCGFSDQTETRGCTRASQDGASCGDTTCGDWSACDWSGFCDEVAQQTRSCTDFTCQGGVCDDQARTEQLACSRSRSGMSCGADTCGGFGGCNWSSECDQSAQRSRTCFTYTCSGGDCPGSPYTDSETCSRGTDGQRCGSNPNYCGTQTECHLCSGGDCTLNSPHYNGSCTPSCGEASRLCGGPHECCTTAQCGGACACPELAPTYDCDTCCAASACF